jgi:hypothetical protein
MNRPHLLTGGRSAVFHQECVVLGLGLCVVGRRKYRFPKKDSGAGESGDEKRH